MKATSVTELNVFAAILRLWGMVHQLLKSVVFQRLEVKIAHFHDYFQSYEMDDTVLHRMLVSQHIAADPDTEQRAQDLRGSEHEADLGAVPDEQVRVVVSKLHNVHSVSYFGAKNEVESQGARELYEPNAKSFSYDWGICVALVGLDRINHADEKAVYDKVDYQALVEEL